MHRRAAAAAIAAGLLLAGCVGWVPESSSPGPTGSAAAPAAGGSEVPISDAEHAALVAAAGLDACPAAATPAPASSDLPDLVLPCLGAGPEVALSALGAKPYVLVVWGAWCVPCAAEMPFLQEVYAESGDDVGFLGIDIGDPRGKGLAWAAAREITFPSLEDPRTESRTELRYLAPPWSYFVDAGGRIVGEHVGAFESAAEVRDEIEAKLGVVL